MVEYTQLDTSYIKEGDNSGKCVFVLVFQDMEILRSKIDRICKVFFDNKYELPG